MLDEICVVEVGLHTLPHWRDKITGLVVCDRHRSQYTERIDLGPFDWEEIKTKRTQLYVCPLCGSTKRINAHTTQSVPQFQKELPADILCGIGGCNGRSVKKSDDSL